MAERKPCAVDPGARRKKKRKKKRRRRRRRRRRAGGTSAVSCAAGRKRVQVTAIGTPHTPPISRPCGISSSIVLVGLITIT